MAKQKRRKIHGENMSRKNQNANYKASNRRAINKRAKMRRALEAQPKNFELARRYAELYGA